MNKCMCVCVSIVEQDDIVVYLSMLWIQHMNINIPLNILR